MRAPSRPLAVGLAIALASCGTDGTGPDGSEGPGMSARINGTRWDATYTLAVNGGPGQFHISGNAGNGRYGISLQLGHVTGADTFALGVGTEMVGGRAVVTSDVAGSVLNDSVWTTDLPGFGGDVIITTLTPTRIAGTFSFVTAYEGLISAPGVGTATDRAVTQGAFDIPLAAGGAGLASGATGYRLEGTIGGTPYRAQNMAMIWPAGPNPTFALTAGGVSALSISLAEMPGPGTYALDSLAPVRTISVIGRPGLPLARWSSNAPGGSGSVVITSVTPERIQGTFTATLAAVAGGASGTLAVSGAFDLGRAAP